jgi:hypothetical protein
MRNMEKDNNNFEVQIIYNDEKVLNFGNVQSGYWRLRDIDDFENSKKMIVLLNKKVINFYDFEKNGELFKQVSYRKDF